MPKSSAGNSLLLIVFLNFIQVTDDWDRRVLKSMLGDFYNEQVLDDNYAFSAVESFYIPKDI